MYLIERVLLMLLFLKLSDYIKHFIYSTRGQVKRAEHAQALDVNISTLSAWANGCQRPNETNAKKVIAYGRSVHTCERCQGAVILRGGKPCQ